ncbi:TonB-dependent receptor precursor [Novosphingobium resinovorum]|uniref:TonB-dependent receptor n=1 Tax=Novosphingobium resinovorum TaxID=158500 RepID=A0A031JUA9_9SPHN|nr:TonB-dependent receptor [Novosphingobium resinovorum]EZP80550.1 TonB-dependent receptor precursor [Novosphingobium resinovorum]
MMNARILLAAGVSLAALVPGAAHAQVEDIVVTARKEKETLQEVPISVAAFDQDMIARYDISDLEDIAKRTPNFTFSNNLGMFGGVPVIRGIGAPRTGSNASVGLFIDGVDTGNAGGISLQSFDVERIEVVRGPQSTQFGRGVLAGAINYVSRRPNLDKIEAEFGGEIAEYGLYRVESRVSGPVADSLAFSLAAQRRSFDGFYDDANTGDDMGNSDSTAVIGGIRAQFGAEKQAELYVRLAYSDEHIGQPAWHQVATNTQTGTLASQRWYVGTLKGDPDKLGSNAADYGNIDLKYYRAAAHFNYDFGGAAFSSISAYNRSHQLQDVDSDFTANPDLISGSTLLGNFRSALDVHVEDFSQELRLQSSGTGPFKWLIGGYFRKENYSSDDYSPTAAQGSSSVLAPTPNVLTRDTKTYGVFGSLSYEITPGLTVSQELRYSQDKIFETSQPRAATTAGSFGATFRNWLPRTIVEWQATPDHMLYASVAKGNKPGGFNNAAGTGFSAVPDEYIAYDEEQMWSYEAGFKTAWFDRKLTFNASVFHLEWSDIQVNSQVTVNGYPVGITLNGGKARGTGAEMDFHFQPNPGWEVYGGLGYAPIRILDYVDTRVRNAGITTDGKDQLAGSPDWTGNAGVIHNIELEDVGTLFLQGDVSYRSTTYATEANLAETGSKTTVDVQVGLRRPGIRASLYVNNLLDDKAVQSARAYVNPTNYARSFIVQLPNRRQVGLRLSLKY